MTLKLQIRITVQEKLLSERSPILLSGVRQAFLRPLVLLLFFLCTTPAFSAEEWKKFSPPTGEFSVEIPGDVAVKESDFLPAFNQKTYYQNAQPVHYSVSVIQCDDLGRYSRSILQSRVDETGGETVTTHADGEGWRGILGALSDHKKNYHQTFLFAKAEGANICYVLYSDVHPESADMQRFLSSFSVDPAKCKSAHANDLRFDVVSQIAGYVILVIFIVSLAVTIVFIVRRMKKRAS